MSAAWKACLAHTCLNPFCLYPGPQPGTSRCLHAIYNTATIPSLPCPYLAPTTPSTLTHTLLQPFPCSPALSNTPVQDQDAPPALHTRSGWRYSMLRQPSPHALPLMTPCQQRSRSQDLRLHPHPLSHPFPPPRPPLSCPSRTYERQRPEGVESRALAGMVPPCACLQNFRVDH